MAEVVALHDRVIVPGEPPTDLIETCEELLRMAKVGEIVGLAWVSIDPTGRPRSDWSATDVRDAFALIGGVARLLYRVNKDQD